MGLLRQTKNTNKPLISQIIGLCFQGKRIKKRKIF